MNIDSETKTKKASSCFDHYKDNEERELNDQPPFLNTLNMENTIKSYDFTGDSNLRIQQVGNSLSKIQITHSENQEGLSQTSLLTPQVLETECDLTPVGIQQPIGDSPFQTDERKKDTIEIWGGQRASLQTESKVDEGSEGETTYYDESCSIGQQTKITTEEQGSEICSEKSTIVEEVKAPEIPDLDVEQSLRKLLDLPDVQIFDIHMMLQILRRKFNKNYQYCMGQFKIKQKDEQRNPAPFPKPIKVNNLLRNISAPSYSHCLQELPRTYPVKYDADLSDPNNLSENPPQTTAKALSIFDIKKMTCIYGKNVDHKLEIASMTKIMTAYLCCLMLEQDLQCVNLNPKKVYFRASQQACKIYGTTAHIKEGLRYSIYDLLMGLMLPSGNDAALVLAENFGRFLSFENCRTSIQTLKEVCESDPYDPEQSRKFISRFVRRMNQEASKLKLVMTNFSNPHGLSDKANKSSAQDVVRLTYSALKYPLFNEIIKNFQYESKSVYDWNIKRPKDQRAQLVHQKWYNLNILLNDPYGRYKGVKTGHTPNAGSCLCTLYEDLKKGQRYICVVIGTNSNKHRFQETSKLVNWCIAQYMKKKGLIPQQGSQGLRTASQSGQGANMSSLAKVGNNVMMNMSANKNRNGSQMNNGQKMHRQDTQFQTLNTSKAAATVRPQSLNKVDRMRNMNVIGWDIGIQRMGNLGFGGRFNPNFY